MSLKKKVDKLLRLSHKISPKSFIFSNAKLIEVTILGEKTMTFTKVRKRKRSDSTNLQQSVKIIFSDYKNVAKTIDFSFLCENWMIYFVQFNGTIHVLRNNHVAYFNFVEISGSRRLVKLQLNSDVKAKHIHVFYYTPFKLHPKNIQFIEIFEFSIWSRPS